LHWLIRQSLFRATIGAVISESIVATDASASLQHFGDFDAKFHLLLSKLPSWMFPKAIKGRQAIGQKCQGTAFYEGLSQMVKDRHELLAQEKFGISSEADLAMLSIVLVWAAAANTMPTGFWLVFNLLKQKETAHAAIQKEVFELYQSRNQKGPLSVSELDQLVGLDSALTETLRIYSESMMARDVMEDFELDLKIPGSDHHKYFLKKNSRVAIMPSCLHMDDSVFANAHAFQWDRFLPDAQGKAPVFTTKSGKVLATPVRPFGGGISMCPGRKFASYEIKAFVAELLYRYDLELVEQDKQLKTDPTRAGLGIYVPLGDVDVRITKRSVE
jgi:cytochrome P450